MRGVSLSNTGLVSHSVLGPAFEGTCFLQELDPDTDDEETMAAAAYVARLPIAKFVCLKCSKQHPYRWEGAT